MGAKSERATGVSQALADLRGGDSAAFEHLVALVYDELRSISGALMRGQAPGHTLQPTAVVHEALIRLLGEDESNWHDRQKFFAAAVGSMRRVLVDHARKRGAVKRGGDWTRVTLTEALASGGSPTVDVLALNDALDRLASVDAQAARVVELRYFGGLTIEAAAEHLGVGTTAVKDDWAMARAWLHRELS